MKEASTIAHALNIGNGRAGVARTLPVIGIDNCHKVVRPELGCTAGIDHP
jgi:hypothetical protein